MCRNQKLAVAHLNKESPRLWNTNIYSCVHMGPVFEIILKWSGCIQFIFITFAISKYKQVMEVISSININL
jgi:hypothetical protein